MQVHLLLSTGLQAVYAQGGRALLSVIKAKHLLDKTSKNTLVLTPNALEHPYVEHRQTPLPVFPDEDAHTVF